MKNTPHINQTAEISDICLLPGDPLRAEFIAREYLLESKCFNRIRGALGFTGKYKDVNISVFGTGMGIPSMGIYSYELINIFGVKSLIRIGSMGGYAESLNVRDLVIALGASTNSAFAGQYGLRGSYSAVADFELVQNAVKACEIKGIKPVVGSVLTSDTFYSDTNESDSWKKMGILGVEMETAALYMTAARYGARALSLLTVSDHLYKTEELSAAERETSLNEMIEAALETAVLTKREGAVK